MARRYALTIAELEDIIDGWSDDEGEAPTDVVYIPPETVDEISDEENIDDDEMPRDNQINLFTEMPGTFEIEYSSGVDADTEPPEPKKRKITPSSSTREGTAEAENHTPMSEFGQPKWRKPVDIGYSKETEAEVPYEKVEQLIEQIGKKTHYKCGIFCK